jgi:hypothetical protein
MIDAIEQIRSLRRAVCSSCVIFSIVLALFKPANSIEVAVRESWTPTDCVGSGFEVDVCVGVYIDGTIRKGDGARFVRRIEQLERELSRTDFDVRVGSVWLNSNGGNVVEAIKIAEYIRKKQLTTIVAYDSRCDSACVFVLIGGVIRIAGGNVAIHSPYDLKLYGSGRFNEMDQQYNLALREIREFIDRMRIGQAIVDRMLLVPSTQLRKLEFEEMVELGIVGVDAVFQQANPTRFNR